MPFLVTSPLPAATLLPLAKQLSLSQSTPNPCIAFLLPPPRLAPAVQQLAKQNPHLNLLPSHTYDSLCHPTFQLPPFSRWLKEAPPPQYTPNLLDATPPSSSRHPAARQAYPPPHSTPNPTSTFCCHPPSWLPPPSPSQSSFPDKVYVQLQHTHPAATRPSSYIPPSNRSRSRPPTPTYSHHLDTFPAAKPPSSSRPLAARQADPPAPINSQPLHTLPAATPPSGSRSPAARQAAPSPEYTPTPYIISCCHPPFQLSASSCSPSSFPAPIYSHPLHSLPAATSPSSSRFHPLAK